MSRTPCGEVLGLAASSRWSQLRSVARIASRQVDLDVLEDEVEAIVCA